MELNSEKKISWAIFKKKWKQQQQQKGVIKIKLSEKRTWTKQSNERKKSYRKEKVEQLNVTNTFSHSTTSNIHRKRQQRTTTMAMRLEKNIITMEMNIHYHISVMTFLKNGK